MKVVHFRYKYLPEYCCKCRMIRHASSKCVKRQTNGHGKMSERENEVFVLAYKGLEAQTSLRSKLIGSAAWRQSFTSLGNRYFGMLSRSDGSWRRVLGMKIYPFDQQSRQSSTTREDDVTDMVSSPTRIRPMQEQGHNTTYGRATTIEVIRDFVPFPLVSCVAE